MKCFLKKNYNKILLVVFIIGILGRLWLIAGSNWFVNIDSYFDSHLEVNSAINILSGKWMGEYSRFTLCKNPSFPIFLAVLYFLHIPYAYGLGIFMILGSLLFVKAIKPIVHNKTARLIIFFLVLYNPVGMGNGISYQYRNGITPWAVLMCLDAIIAIFLRKDKTWKQIFPWSILGMFSTGFFWMLREDSIWFLPFILAAFIFTILYWIVKKIKRKQLIFNTFLAFCPTLGIILSILTISTLNYYVYGIFAPNDRTSTYSAKALGLLVQIDDGSDLESDYWVSSKTVEMAKEVSPTFASINHSAFDSWPKIGDYSIWAFRDALTTSGYYIDAKETEEVYKKIVEELEMAFKQGRISKKKAIQLSSTSGIYSSKEIFKTTSLILPSLFTHVDYRYIKVDLESIINSKTEGDLVKYEKILGIDLLRTEEELNQIGADKDLRELNKVNLVALYHNKTITNLFLKFYQITGWIWMSLGIFGFIYLIIKILKKEPSVKYKWEVTIIMLGLLLTTFLNAYIVGLWGIGFNLNAHSELFIAYTNSQYILIEIFEILGCIYTINWLEELKKKDKKIDKITI